MTCLTLNKLQKVLWSDVKHTIKSNLALHFVSKNLGFYIELQWHVDCGNGVHETSITSLTRLRLLQVNIVIHDL